MPSDPESTEKEYLDASTNVRHHGTLRFAQLTLFLAITGALINVAFARPPLSHFATLVLELLGLVAGCALLIMEERTARYWWHYRNRAATLEKGLGYAQYSDLPIRKGKWLTAQNATRVLYVAVIVFWVVAISSTALENRSGIASPASSRAIPARH